MTKDQEFKLEFFALLRKYNAEMYTRESYTGWNVDGVSFTFNGDGDFLLSDLDLSKFEDGKEYV